MLPRAWFAAVLVALVMWSDAAIAQSTTPEAADSPQRQTLDAAWWTGPILAPSAATLPPGGVLVEPYLFDVVARSRYDGSGVRRSVPRSDGIGSLTYVLYGLADGLTVGVIPTAGFNEVSDGPSSSGIRLGDLTAHAAYRLTRFTPGRPVPAMSFVVQESLPTGKFDRLGTRPSDAYGSGAYTTTLALFTQSYFWMPNGRILRTRVDLAQTFSSGVDVRDASVYGTSDGFRGRARPGAASWLDASLEYSVTRGFVLATDVMYRHDRSTRVAGANGSQPIDVALGSSDTLWLAPAIEYSWSPNVGVLVGARITAAGRNTSATITPVVAINMFRGR